jgi:type I restriction enzyme S subunit
MVQLAQAMEAIIDYRGKSPRKTNQGIPLITAKIVKNGRIDEPTEFIDPANYDEWMRRGLPEVGDVLITTEAPLGEVAQVLDARIALAQRLIALRGKKEVLDNTFLKFLLQSAYVQDELRSRSTGTTVLGIKQRELRRIDLPLPPLPEQRSIAGMLGSLDDKIELNRRMNHALESMARTIFETWFISFEPVKAKIAGAVEFPGMPQEVFNKLPDQWAETKIGPVPMGWNVGSLGEVMEHPRRPADPSSMDPLTPYIGLEHMPKKSIALWDWGTVGNVTSNKHQFERGELLFGKLRPYFHKVGIAPIDGVCSTDVVVIRPHTREWFGFVLGHISSDAFVAYTSAASTGTKMPRTNWKDMSRFAVALPPVDLANTFSTIVEPNALRILAAVHESRVLAALRNALLPKLTSGELRVSRDEGVNYGG